MAFRRFNDSHLVWFGLLALTFLSLVQAGSDAQADDVSEALPIDIAADFTYSSLYYWRGFTAGAGSFAMPSVDVSYSADPVSIGLNVWYAQGFEADDNEANDNSEIDCTLYAGIAAGPVDISFGVIDYVIPVGAPFADGHVLEANAGVSLSDLPFDNHLTVYFNLDGDEDNSIFIAPSVGYSDEDWNIGLTLGMAGGTSAYYGTDGFVLIDITPSVSYSIPFGDTEAAISLSLGYNPEMGTKMPFFTFGTGFSL